jgi:hypothetical protein
MNQKNVKTCYTKLDKHDKNMKKACKQPITNLYGMWKNYDRDMKKHIFKTLETSNPPNKKNK